MYCPKCSQEQKSKELKFCSKCGLPLEFISKVVETGQEPTKSEKTEKKKEFFTRRRIILFSVLWFVFWFILVLPMIAMVLDGEDAVEVFIVLISFALTVGIATIVFAIFKQPYKSNESELQFNESNNFETTPEMRTLNSRENPTSDYISPNEKIGKYDTNDLVEVRSVTEETTKLLNKNS